MPSSGANFIRPSRPRRRPNMVSAGVTCSPRKDSRVRLKTQNACFICLHHTFEIISFYSDRSLFLSTRDGPGSVRSASYKAGPSGSGSSNPPLSDFPSPAVDQNKQHNHETDTCNQPNQHYVVHTLSPFFLRRAMGFARGASLSPDAYNAIRTPSPEPRMSHITQRFGAMPSRRVFAIGHTLRWNVCLW